MKSFGNGKANCEYVGVCIACIACIAIKLEYIGVFNIKQRNISIEIEPNSVCCSILCRM